MNNDISHSQLEVLADAISKAIGENPSSQRFIDLQRIPLICLNITGINRGIEEIKIMMKDNNKMRDEQHKAFLTKESFHNQFSSVKSIVYGCVALALLTIAGAILTLVVKQ